jgi:hypothetical protein
MGKLYHVYIDEGGIFGTPHMLITDTKKEVNNNENDITNYYQGRMTLQVVYRYIRGLRATYKGKIKCSADSYVLKTLESYYLINFDGEY